MTIGPQFLVKNNVTGEALAWRICPVRNAFTGAAVLRLNVSAEVRETFDSATPAQATSRLHHISRVFDGACLGSMRYDSKKTQRRNRSPQGHTLHLYFITKRSTQEVQ